MNNFVLCSYDNLLPLYTLYILIHYKNFANSFEMVINISKITEDSEFIYETFPTVCILLYDAESDWRFNNWAILLSHKILQYSEIIN